MLGHTVKNMKSRKWSLYQNLRYLQPGSQDLSSYHPALAPGGGKMRDPGNEVRELFDIEKNPSLQNRPVTCFVMYIRLLQSKTGTTGHLP